MSGRLAPAPALSQAGGVTLADLDALIGACSDAAMILMTEAGADHARSTDCAPGHGGLEHAILRELPVLMASAGLSRVLSGAEGLRKLGSRFGYGRAGGGVLRRW